MRILVGEKAIDRAKLDAAFCDDAWLTFYLAGQPENLPKVATDWGRLDALNLEGAETGFISAKVPVRRDKTSIGNCIAKVLSLAIEAPIRIDIIDLDASLNVSRSKFYTL